MISVCRKMQVKYSGQSTTWYQRQKDWQTATGICMHVYIWFRSAHCIVVSCIIHYTIILLCLTNFFCPRILSKMFQTLKFRNTRRVLCEVYEVSCMYVQYSMSQVIGMYVHQQRLTEKDPSLSQTLSIIKKVNVLIF